MVDGREQPYSILPWRSAGAAPCPVLPRAGRDGCAGPPPRFPHALLRGAVAAVSAAPKLNE